MIMGYGYNENVMPSRKRLNRDDLAEAFAGAPQLSVVVMQPFLNVRPALVYL
jgi:hypothetical protein